MAQGSEHMHWDWTEVESSFPVNPPISVVHERDFSLTREKVGHVGVLSVDGSRARDVAGAREESGGLDVEMCEIVGVFYRILRFLKKRI